MSKVWLLGVVSLLMALVVGAVVAILVTGGGSVDLLPSNSPEGTVQRFLLAMKEERYREAYDHLGTDLRDRCSIEDFLRSASFREVRGNRITLEDTQTLDSTALVKARITVFEPGVPFPSEYSYDRTYELKLEEGEWRLTQPEWWCPMPYPPYSPARSY